MAKKTTKKKTTKKAPSKPARSAAKKTTKKTTKKSTKKVTKKTVKKSAKKATSTKKTASKKTGSKQTTKKSTTKKPTTKKTTKKTNTKKTTTATKKTTKKTTKKSSKKPASTPEKTGSGSKPSAPAPAATKTAGNDKAEEKRPNRRRSSKPKAALVFPTRPMLGSLKNMKPLIASGASVVKPTSVLDGEAPKKIKTPFTKRQLDGYKAILLAKRAELLGDIQHLEDEALKSGSGDSAHTTNHISEQGSDNYDQTLNLNLAAVDRKRLAEIDDALQRIQDKTYGACMITGEPIKKARLDELPWAKYSIQAAQELDRRGR